VGGVAHREDRSRPWEEPDPPLTRTPTSPTSSSSSTSRRRPCLLPRRQAAPPLYTDACTTARGHRGEDDRFPPHVDAPAFEPRWNASSLRAATPPLVMPAFVPGWENLFAGGAAFVNARRSLCLAFPYRCCLPCVATRVHGAAPSQLRSRSRTSPRRPDAPRHRATQHARASNPGAKLDLGPYPLA
jgi:hypothetical protein